MTSKLSEAENDKTTFKKTIVIAFVTALTSGCEMINALDTTNQNTSEMNEDMTEMLGNVGDMIFAQKK